MRALKLLSLVLAVTMVLLTTPAAFASHVPIPDVTPESFTFDPGALGLCIGGGASCPFSAFVKGILHAETTVVPGPAGATVTFTESGTVAVTAFQSDPDDPLSILLPGVTGLGVTYTFFETFSASGTATLTPAGTIDVTFTSFTASAFIDPIGAAPAILIGTATGLPGVTGSSHVSADLAAGSAALVGLFTPTSPFVVSAGPYVEISSDLALVGLGPLVVGGEIQPGSFSVSGGGTQYFGSIVPQPASLLMLGLGLVGMALWSRRRNKA